MSHEDAMCIHCGRSVNVFQLDGDLAAVGGFNGEPVHYICNEQHIGIRHFKRWGAYCDFLKYENLFSSTRGYGACQFRPIVLRWVAMVYENYLDRLEPAFDEGDD